MTIYSSGKHDHLTADPTPWEVDDGGGLTAYGSREDAHHDGFTEVRWEPQPEFDRPLTNPANPILRSAREYHAERQAMNNPKGWAHVLRAVNRAIARGLWSDMGASPAKQAHARAVLQRLASVGMTEGTDQ